jgi:hypothetical protein
MLFGNGDLTNSKWTKRDCFLLMEADCESYWKALQCDAAFCIFQRGAQSLKFVDEWLRYCCDPRILTNEPNTCGKRDLPDFIEHRRDQSVLSLLAQKHNLPLFRMPTQFGNHYKTFPYRVEGEFNCVSQSRQQAVGYYAPIPYYNSPYFQLLDHHRSAVASGKKEQGPLDLITRAIGKRWRRMRNLAALRREMRSQGQSFHPEYWQ